MSTSVNHRISFLLAVVWALLATQAFANAPLKQNAPLVLIVGNNAYKGIPGVADAHWKRLNNATRDADALAARFSELGFNVIKEHNLGRIALRQQVARLVETASQTQAPAVIFYFSGHGTVVDKRNLLIPVDAGDVSSEVNIESDGVDLRWVTDQLRKASGLRVVMLDACRDSPRGLKSATRGLARADEESNDVIIHYAAQAGQTSSDGTNESGLGFYASGLLGALRSGASLNSVLVDTGRNVALISAGRQRPQFYGDLDAISTFVFGGSVQAAVQSPSLSTMLEPCHWGGCVPAATQLPSLFIAAPLSQPSQLAPPSERIVVKPVEQNVPISTSSSNLAKDYWNTVVNGSNDFGVHMKYIAAFPAGEKVELAKDKVGGVFKTSSGCLMRGKENPDATADWSGRCQKGLVEGEGILTVKSPLGVFVEQGRASDGLRIGKWVIDRSQVNSYLESNEGVKQATAFYSANEMVGSKQIFEYKKGARYEGSTDKSGTSRGGNPNGYGEMTFADGGRYKGQWVEGRREGQGEQLYPASSQVERYVGNFVNNLKDGQGIDYLRDGARYEGAFKAGTRNGFGRFFNTAGQKTFEGQSIDGRVVSNILQSQQSVSTLPRVHPGCSSGYDAYWISDTQPGCSRQQNQQQTRQYAPAIPPSGGKIQWQPGDHNPCAMYGAVPIGWLNGSIECGQAR